MRKKTKIFVDKLGGKNEHDKKTALKPVKKSVAQFCQSVKDKQLRCAKGILDSLPKQCCIANKGGKATSFRKRIFKGR